VADNEVIEGEAQPYKAPPARSNNANRDQMMPDMPPCPVCGSTEWTQSPEQAQQDKYECKKCGAVIPGEALKNMQDSMQTDMGT
jgi:ribosomal protein L37AE/L43A